MNATHSGKTILRSIFSWIYSCRLLFPVWPPGVFMSLGNVQNVVIKVLVQNIPRRIGKAFYTTDTQTLALTQCMEHQTLVLTDDLAFRCSDFPGLCW